MCSVPLPRYPQLRMGQAARHGIEGERTDGDLRRGPPDGEERASSIELKDDAPDVAHQDGRAIEGDVVHRSGGDLRAVGEEELRDGVQIFLVLDGTSAAGSLVFSDGSDSTASPSTP